MRINPFGHMFYTSIFLVKIVHNLVALPFEDFCWMQKKVFLEFFDNGCSTMKFESKSVWPGSLGILVIVAQVAKSGANYQIFSSILIYFFSKISPRRFISPPNSKKNRPIWSPWLKHSFLLSAKFWSSKMRSRDLQDFGI